MLENIINHRKKIESLIKDNHPDTDWSGELKFFNCKLIHFQKERLIHLIVTMTVGLATLTSCLFTPAYPISWIFILDSMLVLLFLAYLLHYRKLENTAQSLYPLLDKLREKTVM